MYKTPLATENFLLDGTNSHASSSWNRFAAMRSGEVARIVRLGYDVLHTDVDVAWLRNPLEILRASTNVSLIAQSDNKLSNAGLVWAQHVGDALA